MKCFLYFLSYCFLVLIAGKTVAQAKPDNEKIHIICIDTVYYKAPPYGIPESINNITKHPGLPIAVRSKAYGYKKKGKVIMVYLGDAYPNQRLTVLLKDNTCFLADSLIGKNIKVVGEVIMLKNSPTIEIKNIDHIQFERNK